MTSICSRRKRWDWQSHWITHNLVKLSFCGIIPQKISTVCIIWASVFVHFCMMSWKVIESNAMYIYISLQELIGNNCEKTLTIQLFYGGNRTFKPTPLRLVARLCWQQCLFVLPFRFIQKQAYTRITQQPSRSSDTTAQHCNGART